MASLVAASGAIAQPAASLSAVGPSSNTPPTAAPPLAAAPNKPVPLLPASADVLNAMADGLAKNPNVVVVMVGDQAITQADAADAMRAMPVTLTNLGFQLLYRRVIDQLIDEKLAVLTAQKMGLDKDPNVVRRQKNASDRALADAWINHEADAAVTDQALRARYAQEIAGKPGPEEVHARVILVPTETEAKNLIARLEGGAQFDELARQFSKDGTAPSGGDMGYAAREALAPEVGSVAFSLPPGQFTHLPVHTLTGYFVLRVEGRRQRATPSFDEARGTLTREIRHDAAMAAVHTLTTDIKVRNPETGEMVGVGNQGGPEKTPDHK